MSNTVNPHAESTAIGRGGAWVLANRVLMRAPIWLYRARLGFLFSSRMLMLEHIGRKSGAKRYAVLEVIDHPTLEVYIIASGFGVRAQWFRNLITNPRVRVSVGSQRARRATARPLSTTEADAALSAYVQRYPRAWAKFKNVLENTLGQTITEHDTQLPMVELRLDPTASSRAHEPTRAQPPIQGAL
ncbi:MAG: nitroreductase family deazaflavin-dependent oxidoreductase [Streptosporangiales bacterium]